jgi:hypothetical protein
MLHWKDILPAALAVLTVALLSCSEEADWQPLNTFSAPASDEDLASAIAGKWVVEDPTKPYEFYEFLPGSDSLFGTYIIAERTVAAQSKMFGKPIPKAFNGDPTVAGGNLETKTTWRIQVATNIQKTAILPSRRWQPGAQMMGLHIALQVATHSLGFGSWMTAPDASASGPTTH